MRKISFSLLSVCCPCLPSVNSQYFVGAVNGPGGRHSEKRRCAADNHPHLQVKQVKQLRPQELSEFIFLTGCSRPRGGYKSSGNMDSNNLLSSFPHDGTLQRKSHLCINFLGVARIQSQFPHSCVCERFLYSQDRSTYFQEQNRQIDRGNIHMYKSPTDT
jgi:hypothetical protein